MDVATSRGISRFFEDVNDPRVVGRTLHRLTDVVMITICGVLGGCNNFTEIEMYASENEAWFSRFLELPHGIPSHDTLSRVFARLCPQQLNACFARWVEHLAGKITRQGRTIAIDGKTARRSGDPAQDRPPLHMVSAWASELRLILGQVVTQEKSNEITAIPELLQQLELRGAVVTIDAMGCQQEIAQQIRDQGGHYELALKANQQRLHTQAVLLFAQIDEGTLSKRVKVDQHEVHDFDHGRQEERYYTAVNADGLRIRSEDWPGLKSVGRVVSHRTEGGQTKTETRYYLRSRSADARAFADAVRRHWGIENSVHWVLDVVYREDDARHRKGHGQANLSIIRRLTMNLLRHRKEQTGISMKILRKQIGWRVDHLAELFS